MTLLLTVPLAVAHDAELSPGFAHVPVLPFQRDKQRLLRGKPPFTFNRLALDALQLVQKSIAIHDAA